MNLPLSERRTSLVPQNNSCSTIRRLLSGLLLAFAVPQTGAAQTKLPGAVPVEQYKLPNGLDVILSPDHNAQVVAVSVWYDVGVRDEGPKQAGYAHLAENLMFDGSANVQPGGHLRLVSQTGGDASSDTEDDITRFYEVLPSNQLALGLWLEADRLRSLTLNDTAVTVERRVMRDERRYRVDQQAYASPFLLGTEALFDSTTCYGYAHAPLPPPGALDSATVASLRPFFSTYYTPRNARLTLTGDFDPAAAKDLITKYYGDIPGGPERPKFSCAPGTGAAGSRKEIKDQAAQLGGAGLFFRAPAHDHADTPALELLGLILGQGTHSRLAVALSGEANLVAGIQADLVSRRRGPSVFAVFAVANTGVRGDSVAALLRAQVVEIGSKGVTDAELTRAKNFFLAGAVNSRQRVQDVAEALQHAATFLGSADAVNKDVGRYMAVTAEDVKRVAASYLTPQNGLTVIVQPGRASS